MQDWQRLKRDVPIEDNIPDIFSPKSFIPIPNLSLTPVSTIPLKDRMKIDRHDMPEQDAAARAANFGEVNLGFSEQLALLEARRCIQCKEPKCVQGCPVMVNIPRFLEFVVDGDLPSAARSLFGDNALPAVTGRVCPQETQCECQCVRGVKGKPVAIGYLERFVADWARAHAGVVPIEPRAATGKKVADAMPDEIEKAIDKPTPFTKRGVQ